MSEEEKKAYNYLKNSTDEFLNSWDVAIKSDNFKKYDYMQLLILLNLIEKQQKEIEELSIIKNGIKVLQLQNVNSDTYYLIAKNDFFNGSYRNALDDFISKDRIREKIKEIKDRRLEDGECELALHGFIREGKIDILEELLEENNNETKKL